MTPEKAPCVTCRVVAMHPRLRCADHPFAATEEDTSYPPCRVLHCSYWPGPCGDERHRPAPEEDSRPVCHNGHPFEPGIDQDAPDQPDPRWCNTCGEARPAPEEGSRG